MTVEEMVAAYTERGQCRCGRCIDAQPVEPIGDTTLILHTVDMVFFEVTVKPGLTLAAFDEATRALKGWYATVDVLDGNPHGYMDLGAWVGDQGLALRYMALGVGIGRFSLIAPTTVTSMASLSRERKLELAGAGLVFIQAKA